LVGTLITLRLTRISCAIALLAVVFGTFRLWVGDRQAIELPIPVRGQNDRSILFFTLAEAGQINVQLAMTQALLEKNPDLVVHFASFPSMRKNVAAVSSFAWKQNLSAPKLAFHELPDPDRTTAMFRRMNGTGPLECLAHPPARKMSHSFGSATRAGLVASSSGENFSAVRQLEKAASDRSCSHV
jgi:hypothetical protein